MKVFCQKCNKITEHTHMHSCAHGIPETHMHGSEYFECTECRQRTFASDSDGNFKFILDK